MKRFKQDHGFTLVELMVVVLIIGILVAVAVPIFAAARSTAQLRTCFANQRTIEGVAQTYRTATGAFPPAAVIDASDGLIVGHYLEYPPVCPLVGAGGFYSIDATGTAQTPAGCPHGHY